MPWNETSAMDQRRHFIADYLEAYFPFSELCRRYGISRPTGYKWVQRYSDAGVAGLIEQSRRPDSCPHATSSDLVEAILEARRKHPTWGAKKLLALLQRSQPHRPWPARTTVCDILKRHGLVPTRRTRRRPSSTRPPQTPLSEPNHVWTADFKGQFKTLDGRYCYPLTVVDGYSRFLLGCQALDAPQGRLSRPVFHRLFRTYGLPRIIRTDNGAPFASSQALGRLSQLSVWWIRLGILPERIQPGCPHQNGRHERLHGTLKREATIPPAGSRFAQQYRFTRFRHEYNQERPHEALQQQTPVEFYQASPRPFPRKLPPLHYPAHWEVRLVSGNGGIRWKTHRLAVTHALRQQPIGLEPIDDGVWEVWFGPLRLGRMDERQLTITDRSSKTVDRKL